MQLCSGARARLLSCASNPLPQMGRIVLYMHQCLQEAHHTCTLVGVGQEEEVKRSSEEEMDPGITSIVSPLSYAILLPFFLWTTQLGWVQGVLSKR